MQALPKEEGQGMTNPTNQPQFVNLCVYERRHGTFATLGNRVLFGPFTSPTGTPSRTYKISIKALREIIEHAERTGEPE